MNPYRDNRLPPIELRRRRRGSVRKTIGLLLIAIQACDAYLAVRSGMWGLWIVGSFWAIVIASVGRSRTPYTRLCALQWNRGDRLGAALLFFNVIEPRYSAKRIARNRAALAAAQVGMPKEWWFNSFAKREDDQ
jgi:hypothetical protein